MVGYAKHAFLAATIVTGRRPPPVAVDMLARQLHDRNGKPSLEG